VQARDIRYGGKVGHQYPFQALAALVLSVPTRITPWEIRLLYNSTNKFKTVIEWSEQAHDDSNEENSHPTPSPDPGRIQEKLLLHDSEFLTFLPPRAKVVSIQGTEVYYLQNKTPLLHDMLWCKIPASAKPDPAA